MLYKIIAVILGISGILVGLYVGIVVCLVGGINMIVDGVNVTPANGTQIGWGVTRILLGDSAAVLTIAFFWFAAGFVYYQGEERPARRKRVRIGRPLR